jgi:succinate dehydrogenase/fumarate reductase flavoprotein subunit
MVTNSKEESATMNPVSNHSPQIEDVDVLIIGSGAAGLSVALSAAKRGLKVLVVEKRKYLGGTSARSGGWLWVPGNRQGIEQGDTREEAAAYIKSLAGKSFNKRSVDHFLDEVPEALSFFENDTDVEFVYPEAAPDYRMETTGAKRSGRAITVRRVNARVLGDDRLRVEPYLGPYTVFGYMPEIGDDIGIFLRANQSFRAFFYVSRKLARTWLETLFFGRGLVRTNGNALLTRLVLSTRNAGIPLWTDAGVTDLVRNPDGDVVGVTLEHSHRQVNVTARVGVVIAAGGFGNNPELRKKFFPHDTSGTNHFTATIGHDGESVRLGVQAGAAIGARPHQPAAWAPVTVWKNLRGQDRIFPHLRAFGLPGLIAVNPQGERFANESLSYHDFGMQMQSKSKLGDKNVGYIIADGRAMHKYGIGYAKPWPFPTWYFRRIGFLYKARSLDELAAQINVPAAALTRTIEEFNLHARTGEDPRFNRGSTWFHNFKGDMRHKPNPNLEALDSPPYYAVPLRIGDLGTYVGLSVTTRGEVLNAQGQPIKGLYAVGTAAESVFGGGYPGYGAVLGPAMVLGYAIGRDLALTATTSNNKLRGSTS